MRRDVDKDVSWWFSIPGLGAYIKQLCKGVCGQWYQLLVCANLQSKL